MNLEQTVENLPGFKIVDTHFRIGSKIHISDFYYAKRFFQNGFFSSRIAFIVAGQILKEIREQNLQGDIAKNGLTIIGYEMYSELLISLVDKFIAKRLGLQPGKINHNLYEDFANLKLCKNNNLLQNIVIVVPIASTFSTAIKIEQQIYRDQQKSDKAKPNIMRPHLNVLFIADELSDTTERSSLEKSFNWISKDLNDKTVLVDAIYPNQGSTPRLQQYFLTLPSKWFAVESCGLCHPVTEVAGEEDVDTEVYKLEKPLYETDQTSVTPSVVFDFPKGRKIDTEELSRPYTLDPKIVSYGHQKRNDSHFLYAINTESFLDDNFEQIRDWLITVRTTMTESGSYKETQRIIIIANCHFSNVSFITMVNDFVFGSSANIIHYDPANDYVQNFRIVHGKEVGIADKIYFVDDSLKSGTNFERIHQFIQNTVTDKKKGINGCFLLLNKCQSYTLRNVMSRLIPGSKIYAFANLHLHTSLKPYEISPLQLEQARYSSIIDNSLLDILKDHFQKQSSKLDITKVLLGKQVSDNKSNRHLLMLIATHRIFQYFTVEKKPVLSSFDDFLGAVLEKTACPQPQLSFGEKEVYMAYLKVLTQSPFVQFKPLKDRVFSWVLELLINEVSVVKASVLNGEFSYEQFNRLKFFIRRAGLLNSNFLISVFFLEFLSELYQKKGIPKLLLEKLNFIVEGGADVESVRARHLAEGEIREDLFAVEKREAEVAGVHKRIQEIQEAVSAHSKLKYFYIFYIAQIKELILKNESRCLKLEENLDIVEQNLKLKNARERSPYVQRIKRILREENAIVIKMFYDHLSSLEQWPKLYHPENKAGEQVIDYTNEKISAFISKSLISQHHKAQTLNTFLTLSGQGDIPNNPSLLNYLWVQYFLSFDKAKKISLSVKTGVLLQKLLQIFQDAGVMELGAFFIVNDSKENLFVAFNQSKEGTKEIDDERLIDKDGYLCQFLNGKEPDDENEQKIDLALKKARLSDVIRKKPSKTIIEFRRNQQNGWDDMYSTSLTSVEITDIGADLVPIIYDRMILVRLNKKSKDSPFGKPQGVLGFYYKSKKLKRDQVNLEVIKYLLLLRPQLSQFIQNHHESDEFRDWKIAEIKQRTSLLTGHGRDMLINIALTRGAIYKNIVSTLLTVQRFLIDKKEEVDVLCVGSSRVSEMFKLFYQKSKADINRDFFSKDIVQLAVDIFKFDEIENAEVMEDPILELGETINFVFDRSLLKMICFELLVNAKKNRWLFLGKEIVVDKKVYTKNQLWITANHGDDGLTITISNTGALVEDMAKIKRLKNIKKYDNSSGIEMIDTMLREFDLGFLELDQEPISGRFAKFMVTLFLKNKGDGSTNRP